MTKFNLFKELKYSLKQNLLKNTLKEQDTNLGDTSITAWNNNWIDGNDGDGNTVEFSGLSSLAQPGCMDPCANNFSPAFKYTYIPAGTNPDYVTPGPGLLSNLNPFAHLNNVIQLINPNTTNAQVAIHEFNSEGGVKVNIDCSGNAVQSIASTYMSAESNFIPILFKSYEIINNGDNSIPFCFNPDTELQDTGIYPAGGAMYGDTVMNSGQYQTEQLQNSNLDISCCNYSKPYLATLQGDGSVSYKPDDNPSFADNFNLDLDYSDFGPGTPINGTGGESGMPPLPKEKTLKQRLRETIRKIIRNPNKK